MPQRRSLWYIVHYQVRRSDGVVVVHHELVVVQDTADLCYDLAPRHYLVKRLSGNSAHRIITNGGCG